MNNDQRNATKRSVVHFFNLWIPFSLFLIQCVLLILYFFFLYSSIYVCHTKRVIISWTPWTTINNVCHYQSFHFKSVFFASLFCTLLVVLCFSSFLFFASNRDTKFIAQWLKSHDEPNENKRRNNSLLNLTISLKRDVKHIKIVFIYCIMQHFKSVKSCLMHWNWTVDYYYWQLICTLILYYLIIINANRWLKAHLKKI